jgi:hypothetical protein
VHQISGRILKSLILLNKYADVTTDMLEYGGKMVEVTGI